MSKVRPEDLLQPSHPEFRKVYPKEYQKFQEDQSRQKKDKLSRENRLDRALWEIDKKSWTVKNRFARDEFFAKHPEFKEVR